MGERSRSIEAGNARKGSVGSEVEEDLVRQQHTRPSVIQGHLKCFQRHKTPAPHDQFGAAHFVVLQMPPNLTFNHLAFAPPNRSHIDSYPVAHLPFLPALTLHMPALRA